VAGDCRSVHVVGNPRQFSRQKVLFNGVAHQVERKQLEPEVGGGVRHRLPQVQLTV